MSGYKPTTMSQKRKLGIQGSIAMNKQAARQRRLASKRRQATVTMLRQMGEKKGVDSALTLNPVLDTTNTNGNIFVANLIAPGTGSFNRVGRKLNLQSLRVRGTCVLNYRYAATTYNQTGNIVRMVVVWDKQPTGVLPIFNAIFGLTDQAGTEASTYLDPVRYDNMDRFQILRDVTMVINPEASGSLGGTENYLRSSVHFDEFVNLGGREVVYSGQSSPCTIADISTGGLYIVFRSAINDVSTFMQISDDSYCRLRYTD